MERIKRFSITAFLIAAICIIFASGKAKISLCSNNAAQEWEKKQIEEIPQTMQMIREKLEEDPSHDFTEIFLHWTRVIIKYSSKDSDLIEKYGIIDLYAQVIEESTHIDTMKEVIGLLVDIGNTCDKKEKIIPILEKGLNHKFIDIRLLAADNLFKMGYREGVYPTYVNIIAQPDIEKKLDKEFRSQFEIELNSALRSLATIKDRIKKDGKEEFEESMEIKRKETEIEKIKSKIANAEAYKSGAVTHALEKLINYDNTETRGLVKRVVREDTYVAPIISNVEREIESIKIKWAKERSQKFLNDLFKYIEESK